MTIPPALIKEHLVMCGAEEVEHKTVHDCKDWFQKLHTKGVMTSYKTRILAE